MEICSGTGGVRSGRPVDLRMARTTVVEDYIKLRDDLAGTGRRVIVRRFFSRCLRIARLYAKGMGYVEAMEKAAGKRVRESRLTHMHPTPTTSELNARGQRK